MRDKNGFLDINNYIDLGPTSTGENVPHWLSKSNNEFVFKSLKGIRLYRELVYPIILRNIKVEAVENDLATFNGEKGILSKSYHAKEEEVFSFSSIIKQYCNDVLHEMYYKKVSSLYNIGDINTIFKWYNKLHGLSFEEQTIKNSLFLDFILQILLAHDDNAPINKEAYVSENFKLSPYFDFEYYGDINIKRTKNKVGNYLLDFYTDRLNEKPRTYIETIERFKYCATKEELEIFMSYLEQLKSLKMSEQFMEAENQIHAHIPLLMKLKLKKDYESNLKNVDALVNDKK